ncbi:MAG: nucleotide exchange factor GrpE [Planctomycetota bacterium]|nr:nucleotide exchange factor GrpE [Planctomycetota bacterium]
MSKSKKKSKDSGVKSADRQVQAEAAGTQEAEGVKPPRAERDDLMARLQRVSADYLNYQRRVQRDIEQAREFANEDLIKSMLAVLDDMERALGTAGTNHDADDPLLAGMQLVHDKALETLGRFGLGIIEAEGKMFDPEKHLALMQQATDASPPMTVLKEVQRGYQLKGRTIRPARVIVAKAPDQQEQQQEESP